MPQRLEVVGGACWPRAAFPSLLKPEGGEAPHQPIAVKATLKTTDGRTETLKKKGAN